MKNDHYFRHFSASPKVNIPAYNISKCSYQTPFHVSGVRGHHQRGYQTAEREKGREEEIGGGQLVLE